MNRGRLPQIAAIGAAIAVLLLVALYVARPHQTEVSTPSARGPTAARSVYPSIVVDTPQPPTPSPDTSPRILDVESGNVEPVHAPSDLTFVSVLTDGSFLFANGVAGPAFVLPRDGSLVTKLDISDNDQYLISQDRRYVLWMTSGQRLHVFDATTKDTRLTIPPGAHFDQSLSNGALLVPDFEGFAIIDPGGSVEKTIGGHTPLAISPDRESLAWIESSGLHMYSRVTQRETTNSNVALGTSRLTWSPDASELALERLVGDNSAHVDVLEVISGVQHEVYAAAPNVHVEPLRFVSSHRLEFGVIPPELARYGEIAGPRYQINDDGSGGEYIDPAFPSWGMCGPRCGMPPQGFEDANGIARWCDPQLDTSCINHVSYINRASNKITEIFSSVDFVQIAISPDRTRAAFITTEDDRNQSLHLVDLDNLDKQQFALGFTFANNLTWLDGHSLLLTAVGGN